MKRILSFLVTLCCLGTVMSYAQQDEMITIEIGMVSTTHVLFSSDLTYVDISVPEVIFAKVVEASQNMLAIKARKEFDFVTTISALEANGTWHTFKVRFNSFPKKLTVDTRVNTSTTSTSGTNTQVRPKDAPVPEASQSRPQAVSGAVSSESSNFGKNDAPTLEEVIKKPQKIYHIGDRNFNLEVYCSNIFVYSGLTYIVLSMYNNTDIGFEAGEAQFNIENLKQSNKALATNKLIWPKSTFGTLSCAPRSQSKIGYTIPKLTLLKNECLRIYIYEKSGSRNLILTLTDKDVNYAISPK